MSDGRLFSYEEESQSERLARKSREAPIFPVGKYLLHLSQLLVLLLAIGVVRNHSSVVQEFLQRP